MRLKSVCEENFWDLDKLCEGLIDLYLNNELIWSLNYELIGVNRPFSAPVSKNLFYENEVDMHENYWPESGTHFHSENSPKKLRVLIG